MDAQGLDYRRLESMLEDFHRLTHIRISFWTPDGVKRACGPAEGNSAFCARLRECPAIDAQCRECDRRALEEAMGRPKQLHCFQCCAGMNEFVYPAFHDDHLIGFFMYGQVRIADLSARSAPLRRELYARHGLDAQQMEALYAALAPVTMDKIHAAGRMLSALASYAYLSGLMHIRQTPLVQRVQEYIAGHYAQEISLESACQALGVSRSSLCHSLRQAGSESFVALLQRARIDAAKELLRRSAGVRQAALQTGFQSENYFSRVFRRTEGISPRQYLLLQRAGENPPRCDAPQE